MNDGQAPKDSEPGASQPNGPSTRYLPAPARDVLELVGQTPLVQVYAGEGHATVWAKAEFLNPAGSVKDRPALAMIRSAEARGKLAPGATIVEATSGNTGISLAMIAAVRGYRCVVVMPEDMSLERRNVMRAYGAEISLTPAVDGMRAAVDEAKRIVAETAGAFMPSQFENEANPESHYQTTAREIIDQLSGRIDAFVAGVGTGGTVTGVGRRLKEALGTVRVIAVEPKNSAVLSGGEPGLHAIQGLGAGFIPRVLDQRVIDEVVSVSDVVAQRTASQLAREQGLLVGPSAGANVCVAREVARELRSGNVVTVLCDTGERYSF